MSFSSSMLIILLYSSSVSWHNVHCSRTIVFEAVALKGKREACHRALNVFWFPELELFNMPDCRLQETFYEYL